MRTRSSDLEIVPLVKRAVYLMMYRCAASLYLLAVCLVVRPPVPVLALVGVTALWLALSVATQACWRLSRTLAVRIWGGLLLIDGWYLALACWVAGDQKPFVWLLIVGHVTAVALMASYRTGLKLAVWHTLLAFVVLEAGRTWTSPTSAGPLPAATDGYALAPVGLFAGALLLTATSTALLSAASERELRRRRYDMEALARFALELESLLVADDVERRLVTAVDSEFDVGRVVLVSPDSPVWNLRQQAQSLEPDVLTVGTSRLLDRCTDSDRALLVRDPDEVEEAWLRQLLPGARNLVLIPLRAPQQTVGVLVVEHDSRSAARVERRVVGMLERFASHTAVTVQNVALLEAQRRLAESDGLTGLPNRRAFDEAFNAALSIPGGQGAVLLVDIDHFKAVNDQHGHLVGDDVLRGVAAAMADEIDGDTVLARYGGEEFGAVVSATGLDEAWATAERLRRAVAGAPLPVKVTCSIGVAMWPENGGHPAELLGRADEALYAAKAGGRNQVVAALDPAMRAAAHQRRQGETAQTVSTLTP